MKPSDKLLKALGKIKHPKTGKDIVSSGAVQSAAVNGDIATVTLGIDPADADLMEPVRKACEEAALSLPGIERARAIMTAQSAGGGDSHGHPHGGARKSGHTPPPTPKPLQGIRKVIAVASGKGGVGKSTTSVNLAYALQATGLKVALIDCDIYGPSASMLLGVTAKPEFTEDDRIKPIYRNGLAAISMSFIVDPDTAAVWRGPMVIQAVQQFLTGVAWDEEGEIDVAVVDLPPGTGDVQLTLAQTANVDGAIIVSTPQDLALIDARKAVDMFRKTKIPTLGIVENMSYFACPKCGERTDIFGHGGARDHAAKIGVPFLGEIPLEMAIREASDTGEPIVLQHPKSESAERYRTIAGAIIKGLAAIPAQ